MENVNAWLNLAGKLVWPIFIVILMLVFHGESKELYDILKTRIESGASVKLGSFLELGELAGKTEVSQLLFGDLPIEAISGPAEAVRKTSGEALRQLQQALEQSPSRRVDTLLVDSGVLYSPTLLKNYINTLGIHFIVFRRDGKFDGWIESGIFLSQLLNRLNMDDEELRHALIPYKQLKDELVGLSGQAVQINATAREVLQTMQDGHTENLPVLEGDRFRFFANRGEILSRLISGFILEKQDNGKNGGDGA